MNIYLVERSEHDYDEFDGFVVTASTAMEALGYLESVYNTRDRYSEWPNDGKKTAKMVGTTDVYTEPTVILSSYNAG